MNAPTTRTKIKEVILVYNGDSGLMVMLADAAKKAVGIEECALCEITHSAIGERRKWKQCAATLGVPVKIMHRNELPTAWKIGRDALPVVLVRRDEGTPEVLLTKAEIAAFAGDVGAFGSALRQKVA